MPGDSDNGSADDLKAIIFDYGEVLCYGPSAAENAQLAAFFGVGVDRLPALWDKNRGAFDRGDLTPEVYWSMLAEDAGADLRPGDLEKICELDMAMWSNVNASMVEWARQLAFAGMKIGLLSNMHPGMVAHCRKHFSWLKNFDFTTFSGDVRLIKPDHAIYEHTLRGLGVKAEETLFLDDREVNVEAAKALGIRVLRFHSMAQLRDEAQAMGLKVLPQG